PSSCSLHVNHIARPLPSSLSFFFTDTATTEIYTLSLHDALPIYPTPAGRREAELGRDPHHDLSLAVGDGEIGRLDREPSRRLDQDRKSTRLNSSHLGISYAVFCLKKKKKK